jgi:excisionase family DNA binding protein
MSNNGNVIHFPLRFLTVDEAALKLKVSRKSLNGWIRRKHIEVATFGNSILLPAAAVEELADFFESLRRKPAS